METVNFLLIFTFGHQSFLMNWNHNPKEIRNVIFHYLGNGGGRKITHQKWKRCLISLKKNGLHILERTLASFYVAVSIILVCGKIKWTKAGNISFLCYFGRLPSRQATILFDDQNEFWSKLPKNIQKPQQMNLWLSCSYGQIEHTGTVYVQDYLKQGSARR